jgi:FixJ family two-component response regulator
MVDKGKMVSVVDDDESVRKSLTRLLRSVGLKVMAFRSALDFLSHGGWFASGCAIFDVRMPGMDGLTLQEELLGTGSRLPIIFITAHDDVRAEKRALKNGAMNFFRKPFSGEELINAVQAALDNGVEG